MELGRARAHAIVVGRPTHGHKQHKHANCRLRWREAKGNAQLSATRTRARAEPVERLYRSRAKFRIGRRWTRARDERQAYARPADLRPARSARQAAGCVWLCFKQVSRNRARQSDADGRAAEPANKAAAQTRSKEAAPAPAERHRNADTNKRPFSRKLSRRLRARNRSVCCMLCA